MCSMKNWLLLAVLYAISATAFAANLAVFQDQSDLPLAQAVEKVNQALDAAGFGVVDELPIHENLRRMAPRWGEDYNRNRLEGIIALVFCNGWYVNKVSNLDPTLLGLCPLHLTLTHKAGTTTVLFNRPTAIAAGSPAEPVLKEAEDEVIAAIRAALHGK